MDATNIKEDDYFLYLSEYRVLICRACKYAIRSQGGIQRHFQKRHASLPLSIRKTLVEYASQLQLIVPENIHIPEAPLSPIDVLDVIDGCQCNDCGYACGSEGSMLVHCKKEHK